MEEKLKEHYSQLLKLDNSALKIFVSQVWGDQLKECQESLSLEFPDRNMSIDKDDFWGYAINEIIGGIDRDKLDFADFIAGMSYKSGDIDGYVSLSLDGISEI